MKKMNDVLQEKLRPILSCDDEKAKGFIADSSAVKAVKIAERILKYNNKNDIIKELLEKLAKYEEHKPNGRDHVIHAIHTYLLGTHIISQLNENYDNEEFIWKITSLFHDIGYEHADYFRDKSPINKHCNDHGFWSSQITWNILFSKYLDKNPDKSPNKIVEHENHRTDFSWENLENYILPACKAIFLHNKPKYYLKRDSNKVDYSKNRYAFLLILCDTIQNWSRPKNGNTKQKSEQTKPNQYEIKCARNGNKYEIVIKFPNKKEAEIAKNELVDKCHLTAITDGGKELNISWDARPEEDQNKKMKV